MEIKAKSAEVKPFSADGYLGVSISLSEPSIALEMEDMIEAFDNSKDYYDDSELEDLHRTLIAEIAKRSKS